MGQGEAIRAARASQRLTQAGLAGAAGVSVNTVKRAEAGLPVQDETIRGLCAVLGLDATLYPRVAAEAPAPSPSSHVPASDRPSPLAALLRWDPSPEVRALLAAGIVAAAMAPFWIARALAYLRGSVPAVQAPPAPFAWLEPARLNQAFSETMISALLVILLFSIGTRAVRGFLHGEEAALEGLPDRLEVETLAAFSACILLLAPVADGWGVGQQLAILLSGAQAVSWVSGLLLVLVQACVVVWLGRLCGPIFRVPPLVPLGLCIGFLAFAPAQGAEGVHAVAVALVLASAAALRGAGCRGAGPGARLWTGPISAASRRGPG